MNPLAFILAFFALLVSGSAEAAQTCKSKATQQKLAGEALLNFVKQCELDALVACADQTAGKPEEQMNSCVVKALGVGPRLCVHEQLRLLGRRGMSRLLGWPVRKVKAPTEADVGPATSQEQPILFRVGVRRFLSPLP
jgi:hypothetical protein